MSSAESGRTVWWLRHGESTWNALNRMQYGALHPPLTDRGHDQAHRAAQELAGEGIGSIWTSPAVRARQTAEILAQAWNLEARVSDLLVEEDRGESEDAVALRIDEFTRGLPAGRHLAVSHGDTIAIAARRGASAESFTGDGVIANGTALCLHS